jgi:polysaccharide chain length determinant protein (PEP-CTERM system associated)
VNELLDQLLGILRSAWRFRWLGLAAATVLAVGGWLVVLSLPDRYQATGSVFVDTRTAFRPVLEGLIVEDDVISQLGYVRQSILSGPRLEKIAVESGVLPREGVDMRRKIEIISSFSKQVAIEVQQADADAYESSGTIFSISYPDNDPDRAVLVTQTVMDTLIQDTLVGKQDSTENTQKFLEEQIKIYEEKLRTAENRLAEFKKQNIGLMPTDRGDYFSQYQAVLDATKNTQSQLDVALVRRSELARQLRGEAVIGASSMAVAQGSGGDTASRIREAQARLDELLLRFTDKHPDVIEASNSLAELQARRQAEIESLRRGDAESAAFSGLASNPIYQSIQLQLNQADVEIASLRGQLAQHNAKAAELRKFLDMAPKVEAEFAQLNRDYDIDKAQHAALLANLDKARLGERADNAGGVRFQVVQPPIARMASATVHRGLLLCGVLLAALVAGAALTYVLTLFRPVVSSARELANMAEFPVLGVVGAAFPRKLQAAARWSVMGFGLATSVLFVGLILVLDLNNNGFRLASIVGGAG